MATPNSDYYWVVRPPVGYWLGILNVFCFSNPPVEKDCLKTGGCTGWTTNLANYQLNIQPKQIPGQLHVRHSFPSGIRGELAKMIGCIWSFKKILGRLNRDFNQLNTKCSVSFFIPSCFLHGNSLKKTCCYKWFLLKSPTKKTPPQLSPSRGQILSERFIPISPLQEPQLATQASCKAT